MHVIVLHLLNAYLSNNDVQTEIAENEESWLRQLRTLNCTWASHRSVGESIAPRQHLTPASPQIESEKKVEDILLISTFATTRKGRPTEKAGRGPNGV